MKSKNRAQHVQSKPRVKAFLYRKRKRKSKRLQAWKSKEKQKPRATRAIKTARKGFSILQAQTKKQALASMESKTTGGAQMAFRRTMRGVAEFEEHINKALRDNGAHFEIFVQSAYGRPRVTLKYDGARGCHEIGDRLPTGEMYEFLRGISAGIGLALEIKPE